MNLILMFIVLSVINVVLSTARQIITVKGNKYTASFMMAAYQAFNNIVVIFTVADFPMWQKLIITFLANLFGVFIVKLIEERIQKVRLWKFEGTVNHNVLQPCVSELRAAGIPNSYFSNMGKHALIYCYCESKEESEETLSIFKKYHAKYFVTENKIS